MKHIKTILITVKNNFIFGEHDEFLIKEFICGKHIYPEQNAIDKVEEINKYVLKTIKDVLIEVGKQLPNCLDNKKRIQEISFKQVVTSKEKSNFSQYISFFIDVKKDITELPSEIKILPIRIKPNGDVYSFDFQFDKIFIRKQESGDNEENIVGYAQKLKNEEYSQGIYKTFKVKACNREEYINYIHSFSRKYSKIQLNYYAMEGKIVYYK